MNYLKNATDLLVKLIETPSPSEREDSAADIISGYLQSLSIPFEKLHNNIIAWNRWRDEKKPVIVLNSHHDTVQPVNSWSRDPYKAEIVDGKLFGLGSNDAGGSLVSLIHTFIHFYSQKELPYQLVLVASGEEENSGKNGLPSVLEERKFVPDLAIVGEPTNMQMAIAEKGLIVIDAYAEGKASHVAHPGGLNAIYQALADIQWIKGFQFDKTSEYLGQSSAQVTQIQSGTQHNVIPDQCHFVIDVRLNECYTHPEMMEILQKHCLSRLVPRSLKWKPSKIDITHPVVERGLELGLKVFGSNTMSDQIHFNCPSLKIGCGDSTRSHTADEFICLNEIKEGIHTYIRLLENLKIKHHEVMG